MAAASVVRAKSDADVSTDLQGLGTVASITSYSSLLGQTITWNSAPSNNDKNTVLAYFQQNNHMETV